MAWSPSLPVQPGRVDDHTTTVDGWLADAVEARELIRAFQRVLGSAWRRAEHMLGAVAIAAIADRVFQRTLARHPFLVALHAGVDGELRCDDAALASVPVGELRAGVRTVIVELLAVLNSVTAQILVPELEAELARAPRADLP